MQIAVDRPWSPQCALDVVVVGASVAAQAAAERVSRAGARATVRCVLSAGERLGPLNDLAARGAPRVVSIDPSTRTLTLDDGATLSWDCLVLAPTACPSGPALPGADVVRGVEEARAVLAIRRRPREVVVLGEGLTAWEVAAAVRARGIETTLVAASRAPLRAALGETLCAAVIETLTAQGVALVEGAGVGLDERRGSGGALVLDAREGSADTDLAASAGVLWDGAVTVDGAMATCVPGIFAAGDLATWRDPRTGRVTRLAHAAAQRRQGEVAAAVILGGSDRLDALPFRRSRVFDLVLTAIGTPGPADLEEQVGDLSGRGLTVTWRDGERITAVISAERAA